MNETGQLLYGLEWPPESGQLHYDFAVRLPVVADNIKAIQELGVESNLALNTHMLAASIVSLGSIPREQINYQLLAEHLVDDDYDVLAAARERLKKKRMRPSSSLPASDEPQSSSASTASPSSVS